MAEAERIEKKFKYGVEESDQTHFEQYAENWLKRQEPFFKATTYAGYKRNLDIVYPLIGGIPLAKLLPMTLEEIYPRSLSKDYTTRCAASCRRLWTRDTLLTIPHGDVTNRKDKRKSAR